MAMSQLRQEALGFVLQVLCDEDALAKRDLGITQDETVKVRKQFRRELARIAHKLETQLLGAGGDVGLHQFIDEDGSERHDPVDVRV